ncbi:efflux RND transporter periplasmic adaptor subunit [Haloferula rosea]|uniref:Efflux RND transporter periplasmic adaptor subunit n=1 Tax=Haloferula rosea TaxID=490093 RepID=A0A934REL7_9BACT|nr:efflux RND transporter periplasmic adaptor subunit [Haloferula rosea]MBK1828238.1 efflux RND transporter periplasmic adaptor subunit [Haloferula rosea]
MMLGLLSGLFAVAEEDNSRLKGMVLLDDMGVANLGVETEMVAEGVFEESVFAVGRIEEVSSRHGVLSSRIAGRIVEILAYEGDVVEKGQTLVRVESRQPGDPPPVIDLKAPIGGLVTASHVRIGEPVQPDRELMDISDLKEVWAIARVPEYRAAAMKPGSRAWIRVTATGDEKIEGELLRFGTAADRESGTIDAIFRVPNEAMRMRPGMRAEFQIVLSERDGVLSVPREAVQGDSASRYVFVKDFEIPNAFIKAPVSTGQTNGGRIEILGGLFEGDEVVVQGAYPMSFVGAGSSMSLKEALDAAHGHEHNEDGSEMTGEQKESAGGDGEDDHDHGEEAHSLNRFLAIACGLLLVLLVLSWVIRKPS